MRSLRRNPSLGRLKEINRADPFLLGRNKLREDFDNRIVDAYSKVEGEEKAKYFSGKKKARIAELTVHIADEFSPEALFNDFKKEVAKTLSRYKGEKGISVKISPSPFRVRFWFAKIIYRFAVRDRTVRGTPEGEKSPFEKLHLKEKVAMAKAEWFRQFELGIKRQANLYKIEQERIEKLKSKGSKKSN